MNIMPIMVIMNFILALGYKGEVIKEYFKNFKKDWKINLIDTGSDTLPVED